MDLSVTWRWGVNGAGKIAHAGNDGQEATFCGEPAPGPGIFHPPWMELRCPRCEELRAGQMETFCSPFIEEMKNQDRISSLYPIDPSEA